MCKGECLSATKLLNSMLKTSKAYYSRFLGNTADMECVGIRFPEHERDRGHLHSETCDIPWPIHFVTHASSGQSFCHRTFLMLRSQVLIRGLQNEFEL